LNDAAARSNAGVEIMIIVLMGVSGSGKTTVGKILADQLGWDFVEADDFHPPANIEKMHRGIPLDDVDRQPWLEALRQRVDDACLRGKPAVVACSALKQSYRDYLGQDYPGLLKYVYLHGSEELIGSRLAGRTGHFMNPNLLHSQFDTLELPADAIRIEVDRSPEKIVSEIRQILKL
jgi:gluconokinase